MMLILDRRVGNSPRYILADSEDEVMFIPPDLIRCVVFVGIKKSDESMGYLGTGFWVVRPIGNNIQGNFAYLVTAKHVITKIKELGLDQVWLRVNLKRGKSIPVPTLLSDWKVLENSDVAAIKISIQSEWDHGGWPLECIMSDLLVRGERIGIGHEVFFAGLFTKRY